MASLKRQLYVALGIILAFCGARESLRADESFAKGSWKGKAIAVELRDDDFVDARRLRELGRLIEKANEDEAEAIVYIVDFQSPSESTEYQKILGEMVNSQVPSVAFVPSSAIGPGALVALATDAIYLESAAIIGSAGVDAAVAESDKDAKTERVDQKQSILEARARSLAVKKGHRPDVAEAFVDGSLEIKAPWGVISKKGEILTLTAEEAAREWEGAPLLAKGIAGSLDDVLKAEAIKGKVIATSPRDFGEGTNREKLSKSTDTDRSEASGSEKGETKENTLFGKRDEGSYKGKIVVLKVGQDTLATGKASFDFMDRTLKKAELDGASAVIFDMDTPGGFAWYTEGLVLNSLQNVSYPTYTFVNSRAESAGAIIAMGTDHIYMKPAATIGSALVVGGSGQDLAEAMEDKVTQMIIGTVRNIAELKGHNPDVAEAFVTREKEVKIDGVVIHESGNVLNLNTIRATEEIGGRPVLAKGVARDLDEIVEAEGLSGDILKAEPLGMEAFAHWTQKLSVLLIMIGLAGAYMEMNSPGFGLPGLVGVLAFSLFFFGNYLAGNLAGYELAVLLILGLVLIAVEIFLFPGAIVPGAVGAALVLVALGLAMVDRVDLEWKWSGLPGAQTWAAIFKESFFILAMGLVGALGAILLGMRFLPESRFGSRLILQEAVAGGASIDQTGPGEDKESFVGLTGETTTDLLPSGKGRFDGRYLDVVSDGEFIGKGEGVRIIHHEGSRIVVAKV